MSGPIIRKYGFPNFEQIFGKRELEHGVEEGETPIDRASEDAAKAQKPAAKSKTKPSPKKKA